MWSEVLLKVFNLNFNRSSFALRSDVEYPLKEESVKSLTSSALFRSMDFKEWLLEYES